MIKENNNRGEIIIYRADDNTIQLDVRMEQETVWLTQDQMVMLFGRDKSVISRHIRNIFAEGELDKSLVVAKFATPKKYGRRQGFEQEIETTVYNLDVIISVGYRVKSKRGVQFRQWANRILKDYLIKGYVVNEKLRREQLSDLRQLVQIVGRTVQSKSMESGDETQAIFDVVVDYTYALDTLDNYDYERLTVKETTPEERFHAKYETTNGPLGLSVPIVKRKIEYYSPEEKDTVYLSAEQLPEFPGGQNAMFQYISNNVIYPSSAYRNGIQGRVVCQFVVNKSGDLVDFVVVKSSGDTSLDKEAVRILSSMPKWNPGRSAGEIVRVKYTVPVFFKILDTARPQ